MLQSNDQGMREYARLLLHKFRYNYWVVVDESREWVYTWINKGSRAIVIISIEKPEIRVKQTGEKENILEPGQVFAGMQFHYIKLNKDESPEDENRGAIQEQGSSTDPYSTEIVQ
jgi:hypothetical protein